MNKLPNNSSPAVPALPDSSNLPAVTIDGKDVTECDKMIRFQSRFSPYLCERQLHAIELILAGEREGKVAEAVGVSRMTLWRWRNDCHFRQAVAEGRELVFGAGMDRLCTLVPHAVDRVQDQLEAGNAMAPFRILRLLRVSRPQPPREIERVQPFL